MLECEVKLALRNITTNEVRGGDRIPAELFKILKDNAGKCCTQYVSKFVKLSSGHKTGKGQLSIQSRRAMPKNVQSLYSSIIALISHVSKIMLKILQARLQ